LPPIRRRGAHDRQHAHHAPAMSPAVTSGRMRWRTGTPVPATPGDIDDTECGGTLTAAASAHKMMPKTGCLYLAA